jgi:hypothetical protein
MRSTLDDFFGDGSGEKVCACGATENLSPVGYNAMTGNPDMYICAKCKGEIAAATAARIAENRRLGERIENNTEERDQ